MLKRFISMWIFAGIFFGAVNIFAQSVSTSANEVSIKLVAGKIYVIERSQGNVCLSIGDEGILVFSHPSSALSEIEISAVRKIKDESIQYIDESKNVAFQFNGEEVRVINFNKIKFDQFSVVYFVESKVVSMGNHFFAGMFPDIDLGNGVDVEKYTDTISALLQDIPDDVKIVPGKGLLAVKEDLDNYKRMLIETMAMVRTKIKEGKDKSTILQEGLDEQWSLWGNGNVSAEQWMDIIYESLIRGQTSLTPIN